MTGNETIDELLKETNACIQHKEYARASSLLNTFTQHTPRDTYAMHPDGHLIDYYAGLSLFLDAKEHDFSLPLETVDIIVDFYQHAIRQNERFADAYLMAGYALMVKAAKMNFMPQSFTHIEIVDALGQADAHFSKAAQLKPSLRKEIQRNRKALSLHLSRQ